VTEVWEVGGEFFVGWTEAALERSPIFSMEAQQLNKFARNFTLKSIGYWILGAEVWDLKEKRERGGL